MIILVFIIGWLLENESWPFSYDISSENYLFCLFAFSGSIHWLCQLFTDLSWSLKFFKEVVAFVLISCIVDVYYFTILIACLSLSFVSLEGLSWSWTYGSWIYNYLSNQCLSRLKLWVRNLFMARYTQCNIMW